MSVDITSILSEANTPEEELVAAPDPRLDPDGALAYHRGLWPLNGRIVAGKLPEVPPGSDRVRLRRAAEALLECGIRMDGTFARSRMEDPHLIISAGFDGSGKLWRAVGTISNLAGMEKVDLLQMSQQVLQEWGFMAVVDMQGQIAFAQDATEDRVQRAEAGLNRMHSGSSLAPAKLLQYSSYLRETTGPYGMVEWAASDFSAQQAADWCKAGVRGAHEARRWEDLGLSLTQAKEWIAAEISVHGAKSWMDAGYSAADAKPWHTAVNANPEAALAWITQGFSLQQTRMWVGFWGGRLKSAVRPEDLQFLIDAKLDKDQIARLQAAGCDGRIVGQLQDWTGRYKIDLPEALQWAELGPDFIGPGKRGRWHKAGFTPDDIRIWQQALGYRTISLEEVKSKMAAGFDPQAGVEWTKLHADFSNPDLVASWTDEGLEPEDAKPWVAMSGRFCDYAMAERWTRAGFTPAQVKPWVEADLRFVNYSNLCQWQAACPQLASDPGRLAQMAQLVSPETIQKILDLLEH